MAGSLLDVIRRAQESEVTGLEVRPMIIFIEAFHGYPEVGEDRNV